MAEITSEGPIEQPGSRWGVIFGAVGAVVEWFDMMLYGYLAVVFARVFFPESAGEGVALAASLGGFAAGFLMRPIGGVFFGWFGERYGRKKSLMFAITLMTLPMLGTAFLPSYAAVGIVAPLLLLLMRLIQGFSVGGEYSGTLVYLSEEAADRGRGYTAAIATTYSGAGVVLAAAVATLLTATLTTDQLDSWGWRIPYLLGGSIAVVGIFMRTKMDESPHYEYLSESGQIAENPLRDALRGYWKEIGVVTLLTGYMMLVYLMVATFLVSFLETTVGLSHDTALVVSTVISFTYAVTALGWGALSDKWGRRPPMLWGAAILAVVSWPAFELLTTGNLFLVFVGEFMLLIPLMLYTGAFSAAVSEYLPTRSRNAGLGLGYNLGNAVLGATAPAIAQTLINVTGDDLTPAYYMIAASVLILPVIWFQKETAFAELEEV